MIAYQPTFAVITNSIYRKPELIEKSLRASLSQSRIEQVVFVDQNQTPISLSNDLLGPRLKVIHAQVPSVSQARNFAVYPVVDWLIFCDDDGYMDPNYGESLTALIQNRPDLEVIAGSIRRTDTGDFYSRRHKQGGDMKRFWNAKLLMGSNFAVKRTVFESLGRFDSNFGVGSRYGSSEETDFAWNAFFHGKIMIYAPELVVFHVPPFSGALWGEMKKAYRYGHGKSALVRKWLLRGHPVVLLEVLEMFLVPWLRIVQFLLTGQFKQIPIQFFSMFGRFFGLFY